MTQVVLFGNGQNASVAYAYFTHDSPFTVVAFTVDRQALSEPTHHGLPVVPFDEVETLYPPQSYVMHVPVSYRDVNRLRAEKYQQAKAKGYHCVSYVSSKAITWPGLVVGENCMIEENVVIQPFTTLGDNVTIACGSQVGHHCTIEDHCYLAAEVTVCGFVSVGAFTFLGANATLRDGIRVGRECVIGAGALILRSTKERQVYMGQQARLYPIASDKLPRI